VIPSPTPSPTRVRTGVSTLVLAAALALTGCTQQPEANDNGPQPDPAQPGDVVRTPAPEESPPLTVPLPGDTNSPNVDAEQSNEASPSPG
jgi:hypothetical protein